MTCSVFFHCNKWKAEVWCVGQVILIFRCRNLKESPFSFNVLQRGISSEIRGIRWLMHPRITVLKLRWGSKTYWLNFSWTCYDLTTALVYPPACAKSTWCRQDQNQNLSGHVAFKTIIFEFNFLCWFPVTVPIVLVTGYMQNSFKHVFYKCCMKSSLFCKPRSQVITRMLWQCRRGWRQISLKDGLKKGHKENSEKGCKQNFFKRSRQKYCNQSI